MTKMTTLRSFFSPSSPPTPLRRSLLCAGATFLAAVAPLASGQSAANWLATAPAPSRAVLFGVLPEAPVAATPAVSNSLSPLEGALPEAPAPQFATAPTPKHGTDPSQHIAQKWTKTIPSDWKGQPLTAYDKVKLGAVDLYSFDNFAAMVLSAGWEHLTDGEPNYGTNSEAFGKRVGAAAIRETTQGVFTDMVFAPLLHEDPRYYVKGPQYSPVKRTLYAITRPIITRRDNGTEGINGHLLLGYAASAAITPAYYPDINHNFRDVASVWGGGIGGAALGFFVTEFSEDLFRAVHLHRAP